MSIRRGWMALVVVCGASLAVPELVWAQGGGTGGVEVDADGVVRMRKRAPASRQRPLDKARRRADPSLVYLSLPKLFHEAQKHVEAGTPLPERLRYLDGLVKIRYVFVDPEAKDLVIAGHAESWHAGNPERPLGEETGRPVVRLDDLVVALRAVGPGSTARTFGCSLDLSPGALERVAATGRQLSGRSGNNVARAKALAQAAGPQLVRIFGVPPESQFAFVCVEADYLMKRMALGLEPIPVKQVKSHLALLRQGEGIYSRYWFVPAYEPVLVSDDGNAFEIRGKGLRLRASDSPQGESNATESARQFVEQMSEQFPALAAQVPAFADLWNLTDLGVVAALIAYDKLHERADWNLTWVLTGYPLPERAVPKTAETMVNSKRFGQVVNFAVGGVILSPLKLVSKEQREKDASGALRRQMRRVSPEAWSLRVEASVATRAAP